MFWLVQDIINHLPVIFTEGHQASFTNSVPVQQISACVIFYNYNQDSLLEFQVETNSLIDVSEKTKRTTQIGGKYRSLLELLLCISSCFSSSTHLHPYGTANALQFHCTSTCEETCLFGHYPLIAESFCNLFIDLSVGVRLVLYTAEMTQKLFRKWFSFHCLHLLLTSAVI